MSGTHCVLHRAQYLFFVLSCCSLETFQRHVVHKGWLGGWLLPQEKSYFALRLPHGWWLLAVDLALVEDIDMCQYRYFAKIAEERMGPNDAAIIVTHCPYWLIEWFWGRRLCKNLRHLLRGPLRGRARVHLAGDLHFYMRHSFKPYKRSANDPAPGGISPPASELTTPAGGSPLMGGSPTSSRCPTPQPFAGQPPQPQGQLHQSLVNRLNHVAASGLGAGGPNGAFTSGQKPGYSAARRLAATGPSPLSPPIMRTPSLSEEDAGLAGAFPGMPPSTLVSPPRPVAGQPGLPPLPPNALGSSPPPAGVLGTSPPQGWWGNLRVRTPRRGGSPSDSDAGPAGTSPPGEPWHRSYDASVGDAGEWEAPPAGWRLNEPEHLVVCGGGGAFLHPTHVFSYARFRPAHDAAAGPIYVRPEDVPGAGRAAAVARPGGLRRSHPSSSSLYSLPRDEAPHPAGGEYRCAAAFPTAEESLGLGRSNLHTFRHVNSRFDVIGGALYYLLVVSVLPRCSGVADILDAHSVWEVVRLFANAAGDTVVEIFSQSYMSLAAVAVLFVITLGFAKSGGVGAINGVPPAASRRPEHRGFALAVRARMGGVAAQLAYAAAHTAVHLSAAIALLLLLELGIETVIRYEGVGSEGYHSLYRWFQTFEAQHFPDPAGLRGKLSTWTLSLYPNLLKWLFAIFDIPEAIAVSRTAICAAGGSLAALTRLQVLGFYGGVLLYFWVLATPTVGYLFGLYLYISGNWLHVHYDESFSALQVADAKGFLRLHVTRSGELEIFSLGLKDVPSNWKEDPRWRAPGGGGVEQPAHEARWPSRWVPVTESVGMGVGQARRVLHTATPPEAKLKVVDYLLVQKDNTMT